jgi:hypothetical protein
VIRTTTAMIVSGHILVILVSRQIHRIARRRYVINRVGFMICRMTPTTMHW